MADYTKFADRKVVLTLKADDGTASEVEATVEAVNDLGILVRPKGKTKLDLITNDAIIEIAFAAEAPKALKAKTLKPVEYGSARVHLLDRHGYKLSEINALSEQEALDFHESIDHDGLGHKHEAKAASEASAAPAEDDAA